MMIKIILLLAGIALVMFFVSNRRKARAKAGVKIGFVLFVLFGLYAVIRPDDITWIANRLGVDRGTDLMLYVLIMAFAFVTMSTYVRFREQELRYARLARAVALQNAIPPHADLPDAPGAPGALGAPGAPAAPAPQTPAETTDADPTPR